MTDGSIVMPPPVSTTPVRRRRPSMPRLLETMESLSAAEASLFLRGSPVGRRSAAPAAVIAPENCPETEQLARDILIGEGGFVSVTRMSGA